MRSFEGSGAAAPLRVALGLGRFGLVVGATLVRLVLQTAGRPDPLTLEPRILRASDRSPE